MLKILVPIDVANNTALGSLGHLLEEFTTAHVEMFVWAKVQRSRGSSTEVSHTGFSLKSKDLG